MCSCGCLLTAGFVALVLILMLMILNHLFLSYILRFGCGVVSREGDSAYSIGVPGTVWTKPLNNNQTIGNHLCHCHTKFIQPEDHDKEEGRFVQFSFICVFFC